MYICVYIFINIYIYMYICIYVQTPAPPPLPCLLSGTSKLDVVRGAVPGVMADDAFIYIYIDICVCVCVHICGLTRYTYNGRKGERKGPFQRKSRPVFLGTSKLGVVRGAVPGAMADDAFVAHKLPHTYGSPRLEIVGVANGAAAAAADTAPIEFASANGGALRIGVVFCGRQCPGAHNVAAGLVRTRER